MSDTTTTKPEPLASVSAADDDDPAVFVTPWEFPAVPADEVSLTFERACGGIVMAHWAGPAGHDLPMTEADLRDLSAALADLADRSERLTAEEAAS